MPFITIVNDAGDIIETQTRVNPMRWQVMREKLERLAGGDFLDPETREIYKISEVAVGDYAAVASGRGGSIGFRGKNIR